MGGGVVVVVVVWGGVIRARVRARHVLTAANGCTRGVGGCAWAVMRMRRRVDRGRITGRGPGVVVIQDFVGRQRVVMTSARCVRTVTLRTLARCVATTLLSIHVYGHIYIYICTKHRAQRNHAALRNIARWHVRIGWNHSRFPIRMSTPTNHTSQMRAQQGRATQARHMRVVWSLDISTEHVFVA